VKAVLGVATAASVGDERRLRLVACHAVVAECRATAEPVITTLQRMVAAETLGALVSVLPLPTGVVSLPTNPQAAESVTAAWYEVSSLLARLEVSPWEGMLRTLMGRDFPRTGVLSDEVYWKERQKAGAALLTALWDTQSASDDLYAVGMLTAALVLGQRVVEGPRGERWAPSFAQYVRSGLHHWRLAVAPAAAGLEPVSTPFVLTLLAPVCAGSETLYQSTAVHRRPGSISDALARFPAGGGGGGGGAAAT